MSISAPLLYRITPIQLTGQLIEYKLKENRIQMTEIAIGGAAKVVVYLDTVMIAGERIVEAARGNILKVLIIHEK